MKFTALTIASALFLNGSLAKTLVGDTTEVGPGGHKEGTCYCASKFGTTEDKSEILFNFMGDEIEQMWNSLTPEE